MIDNFNNNARDPSLSKLLILLCNSKTFIEARGGESIFESLSELRNDEYEVIAVRMDSVDKYNERKIEKLLKRI